MVEENMSKGELVHLDFSMKNNWATVKMKDSMFQNHIFCHHMQR